jgi:DNA modification methylase
MVVNSPLERKVKDLVPHSQSQAFYGTKDDNFEELVKSIKHFGILQPLVVHGNNVQVGNRRLRAAIEAGMETVPVIESDDPFALPKVVASQLHRNKPVSLIIKELAYLDEAYGIRQGSRSDLQREVFEEVQKWKETLAGSASAMQRLRRINRIGTVAFENNPKGWDDFLGKLDSGDYSITKGLEFLRAKIQETLKQKHNFLMNEHPTNHKLFNKDAFGFEEVEDNSVQCIVTSPPYYKMRDFGLGKKQIGQEKSPLKYARRLADFMNEAKRVLKPDGSMWVILNDTNIDGCYTITPHLFAHFMVRHGWILNDEIIWRKANPFPSTANRAVRAHETIFQFVLNKDFKYNDISNDPKRFTYRGATNNNFFIVPAVNNARKAKICENMGVKFDHHATYPDYIPLIPILLSTDPGDLVMDMFAGTGTTGIVAMQVGRDFVGYEMNPEYHQVAETLLTHYESLNQKFDEQTEVKQVTFHIPIGIAANEDSDSDDDFFKDFPNSTVGEVA